MVTKRIITKEKQMFEERERARERVRETERWESQEPRRDTYMTHREK